MQTLFHLAAAGVIAFWITMAIVGLIDRTPDLRSPEERQMDDFR